MHCKKVQVMIFYPLLTFLEGKPRKICFQHHLHEKDHQQLLCQFLDQLWNVCIWLWICKFLSIFLLFGLIIASLIIVSICSTVLLVSLLRYWVAKSQWMVFNESPESNAPYPLVIESFAIFFSLLDKLVRYKCWYVLLPCIVDVIQINFHCCRYNI